MPQASTPAGRAVPFWSSRLVHAPAVISDRGRPVSDPKIPWETPLRLDEGIFRVSEFVMPSARPFWKGYLKLSLVSCPIALYPASSSSERVSFRQINKKRPMHHEPTGPRSLSHGGCRGTSTTESSHIVALHSKPAGREGCDLFCAPPVWATRTTIVITSAWITMLNTLTLPPTKNWRNMLPPSTICMHASNTSYP
jgi:hypothetical protein